MKHAPRQHQLNLPPVEVANSEQRQGVFSKSEQATGVFRFEEQEQAVAEISRLFDEALTAAGIESKWIADEFKVHVSLVHKWRSSNERALPTMVQVLCLPYSFQVAWHRAMNRRFGFGRAALAQMLEAAGDLAVVLP